MEVAVCILVTRAICTGSSKQISPVISHYLYKQSFPCSILVSLLIVPHVWRIKSPRIWIFSRSSKNMWYNFIFFSFNKMISRRRLSLASVNFRNCFVTFLILAKSTFHVLIVQSFYIYLILYSTDESNYHNYCRTVILKRMELCTLCLSSFCFILCIVFCFFVFHLWSFGSPFPPGCCC